MKTRYIMMGGLLAICCVMAQAQSMKDDYRSIGVYDTWEQSPFRTGALSGNVKVVKNHLYSASGVNRTGHILGVQRSRFGSNTFGARIDLESAVSIGRSGKYVHALVYTPRASSVQLIGLGHRTTNTWNEGTDVEQFWSDPVSIKANTWTDIVAQVKTNENVEIHSIVVVPDCSSPHALTEDFVAYVDEIVVNTSSSKRTSVTSSADPYEEGGNDGPDNPDDPDDPDTEETPYPVNFDKTLANGRTGDGRYIRNLTLTDSQGNVQRYPATASSSILTTKLYLDATDVAVFNVTAGQSYTPYIDYKTDWMHAYAYVDYNRDGVFTNVLASNGHSLGEGSELVSYSAYSTNYTGGSTGTWYNSSDENKGNNTMTMPAFTIPSNLQSGLYRMRLKVDWCNLDAGGNDGSDGTSNQIWSNGGGIVDVLLNVTGVDDMTVKASSYRNGTIWNGDGAQITRDGQTATCGKPYVVVMQPANGFVSESLTTVFLKNSTTYSGYLESDTLTYTVGDSNYDAEADAFTLPAEVMYSSVSLEPMFNQAPAVNYGDVNRDGTITIADVTALVNILLGKDDEKPYQYNHEAADVNRDQSITIADVTALVNVLLGKAE